MATTTARRRRSSYNVRPVWMTWRRTVATLLLCAIGVGGVYGTRVVLALAHLTRESPSQVIGDLISGGKNSQVQAAEVNLNRINIAFYGYGGPGHDGAYLSDSMMVVSIQPRASGPPSVAEISIPRDWFVPIHLKNGVANQRINYAYAAGQDLGLGPTSAHTPGAGAAVADPTVATLLGIHIDHYVGVDFSAFKQGVDSVGGVDVNVPHTFTDDQYPAGECSGANPNCAYMTVHFNAGVQHMNGSQALEFARSRHGDNGEGTDFARGHRQQLIAAALKQKVVSVGGIGTLPDLLNAMGDNVDTDLSVSDMESLYSLVKDVNPAAVEHVSLDDTNFLYDCNYPYSCGAYYLYAHDRTLASLHQFINNVFVDPAALGEHAQVTVEDGSGRGQGASTRWAAVFSQLGIAATDGGAVPRTTATEVIDSSGGRDTAMANWLAQYFGVTVTTVAPGGTAAAGHAGAVTQAASGSATGGITVILGVAEERAFNNLNGSATN